MNRLICCIAFGALLVSLAPAACAAGPEYAGTWTGAIKTPAGDLRIVFRVTQSADGSLQATCDSPDQGAAGLPVDTFAIAGGVLRIEMKMVGGAFEGKLTADARKAEGVWRQSGQALPLTLERVDKLPEPNRPQVPKKPYPYNEEEVTYEHAVAGAKFAATLTYPKSGGPFPAVLLITGSGPQDRDETLMGHKPFLVLADFLTRRGLAVLRADDRGVGKSTGDRTHATTEDYAGDALAGVAYLKTRKEIDPKHIGLIGHSEGADIAPMVAVRSPDVAFLVLLAPSGVTGGQIILEQQALINKSLGVSDEDVAKERAMTERLLAIVNQEKDDTVAQDRIRETVMARFAAMTDAQKKAAGITDESVQGQVQAAITEMLSPWFRFFIAYDPAPTLAKVKVPVLAIWGEKDLQVPPKQNLAPVEKALKASGIAYKAEVLPGLNHVLQTAKTGSPTEYAQIEETVAPAALKVIGDWVVEQGKRM